MMSKPTTTSQPSRPMTTSQSSQSMTTSRPMPASRPRMAGLMLGGGAVALAALGVAMLGWAGDPSDGAALGAPAAAGSAGPAGAALPGRSWAAGTTYVYEIESTRALTMASDKGPGQPRTLALAGRLSISVVGPAPGGDGVLLRLALGGITAGAGAGAALAGDPAQLARAFYAVAEPSGRLASFSFPRGQGGAERATLKGLAGALQLVVPDPAAAAWRATEQDVSGEYEAAYRAAGGAVHKAKERFVRARGPRGLAPIKDPSAYAVISAIDFELDGSGWPRTAAETEALAVKAGSMQIEAKTRTRARLAAIEQTPELLRLAAAEQGALEAEPAADAAGFALARRHADEGLLDGASLQALLGDLAAGDGKLRNRTMARLAALFRLQPDEAARAGEAILGGEVAGEAGKRLIGALGGAGTAEAQRALSRILGGAGAAAARRDAAAALGLTKGPTEDAKRALLAAAASQDKGLASTATLGLGNLARRMTEQGTGDASDAVAALIARLGAATDDAERLLCLGALGNSGDPRVLAAALPYLASADAKLRAAAVEALRFVAGVDDQLRAALGDSASEVRRAAAGALAYHAITPLLPAATLVLQHDPDVATRLALVSALQLRKRQEPNLVELLAWAAASDPAAEVQRAARSAVAS